MAVFLSSLLLLKTVCKHLADVKDREIEKEKKILPLSKQNAERKKRKDKSQQTNQLQSLIPWAILQSVRLEIDSNDLSLLHSLKNIYPCVDPSVK